MAKPINEQPVNDLFKILRTIFFRKFPNKIPYNNRITTFESVVALCISERKISIYLIKKLVVRPPISLYKPRANKSCICPL